MSEILNLAKAYEEELKVQAMNTRANIQRVLEEHENALIQCLEAEHRKIESVILDHRWVRIRNIFCYWGTIVFLIAATAVLANEVLKWQGKEIASRYERLEQLKKLPKNLVTYCGEAYQRRLCVMIDTQAPAYGKNGEYRLLKED